MKKIISMILISLFIMTYFVPIFAVDKALLYMTHYTDYYLKFSNGNEVRTAVVVYNDNVKEYPAYCVEPAKDGVGELPSYEVQFRDILNDDGLWRITTNGYPYKTPQQMGLNNEDEAYMATKQAIYRYIAGEDETYYGGGGIGEAGKRVYNAIARLLDIGYNGTEKIINATASIVQQKGLDFDNKNTNYYSETYSVTSNTAYQNYTVMLDTDKSGILITDENNNIKSKFNAGEKFKVLIPKNLVTTNFTVGINAYLACETKPIFYGEAYDPEVQDYVITTDPYEDVSTNTTLSVKKLQEDGKLIIYKKDNETKKPIKGVSFELYKDNRIVARGTTDSNGALTFSKLDEGSYVVKEIATNSNYILNSNSQTVEIPFNGTKELTIGNEHKKGNLRIVKLDKDNQKVALSGVVFELYSHEFCKVVGTYTTDKNGEIFIEDLRIGTYTLHEASTDKWYNLAEDVEVKIRYNETTDVAVFNELKKGQVKIIKKDVDNKEIPLQGVVFEILDEKGNIVDTITTDARGEAISKMLPSVDTQYTIREKSTRQEYVLSKDLQIISLQQNKVKTVEIFNEKIKGRLQITKVDKKDNLKVLEGAVFAIYNDKKELVQEIITDKNGIATSDLIPYGKYYYQEISTGSKYYLLNDETYEFEIKKDDELIEKTIDNEPVEIEVEVDKEGTIETKPNEIVDYVFSNIMNESNTHLEQFKWIDFIPTDHIRLESMTTGTWNQNLKYDVYYKTNLSGEYILFKEDLDTKENYNLNFTTVKLDSDEYIIETYFDFGRVDIGFKESEKPTMKCKTLSTLKNNDTFTNKTKTVGIYGEIAAESKTTWTTLVHVPEPKKPTLPDTGK